MNGRINEKALRVNKKSLGSRIMRHWQLYLLVLLPVSLLLIFSYGPMYGIIIAFKDYRAKLGILGSPWTNPWYKYFTHFFNSYYFERLLRNTLLLSVYSLVVSTPMAIFLAIVINECVHKRFAKTVQTITYAPHFISTVIMVSIIMLILSPRNGVVNLARRAVGLSQIDFMGQPNFFRHIFVWSGIWQNTGYSSVIYLAALAGVDPSLHEAATVDGANRFQRVWHIDLSSIRGTIAILLILGVGSIMSVGYEKVLLMQNDLNKNVSDIISTYSYEIGLINRNYSLSTAIGLFNSVINLILLTSVNWISRKLTETSLF